MAFLVQNEVSKLQQKSKQRPHIGLISTVGQGPQEEEMNKVWRNSHTSSLHQKLWSKSQLGRRSSVLLNSPNDGTYLPQTKQSVVIELSFIDIVRDDYTDNL